MKKILLICLMIFSKTFGIIDQQLEQAIKCSDHIAVESLLKNIIANENEKAYYLALADEIVRLKCFQAKFDIPYYSGPGHIYESKAFFLSMGTLFALRWAYYARSWKSILIPIITGAAAYYYNKKSKEKDSYKLVFPIEQIYLDSLSIQRLIRSI